MKTGSVSGQLLSRVQDSCKAKIIEFEFFEWLVFQDIISMNTQMIIFAGLFILKILRDVHLSWMLVQLFCVNY